MNEHLQNEIEEHFSLQIEDSNRRIAELKEQHEETLKRENQIWNQKFDNENQEWDRKLENENKDWKRKFDSENRKWNKNFEMEKRKWNKKFEMENHKWNKKAEEWNKRFSDVNQKMIEEPSRQVYPKLELNTNFIFQVERRHNWKFIIIFIIIAYLWYYKFDENKFDIQTSILNHRVEELMQADIFLERKLNDQENKLENNFIKQKKELTEHKERFIKKQEAELTKQKAKVARLEEELTKMKSHKERSSKDDRKKNNSRMK